MDDLVKFEVIKFPTLLIVGKEIRYSYEALESGDNRLPGFWDKCYAENIFAPLAVQTNYIYHISHAGVFLDWHLGDNHFTYIIGMLMKEGATVPEGYSVRELTETDMALCWIKSKTLMETRTVPFESTVSAIHAIGRDCANMRWCMDLYHPLRSMMPDENGCLILDCYIPLD